MKDKNIKKINSELILPICNMERTIIEILFNKGTGPALYTAILWTLNMIELKTDEDYEIPAQD